MAQILPIRPDLGNLLPQQVPIQPAASSVTALLPMRPTLGNLTTPAQPQTPRSAPQLPSVPSAPQLRPILPDPERQSLIRHFSAMANAHQGLTHAATPAHGFWQHLGRIAEAAGNVAGDVVAPGIMATIPGTQLNREQQMFEGQAGLNQIARQEVNEQNANARTLEANSGAQNAATSLYNAEHPEAKIVSTSNGIVGIDPRSLKAAPVTDGAANPVMPLEKEGDTPFALWHAQNPNGTLADYEKAITSAKPTNATPHPGTSNGHLAWGFYAPGTGWTDGNGHPLTNFQPTPPYSMSPMNRIVSGWDPNSQSMVSGTFNERGNGGAEGSNGQPIIPLAPQIASKLQAEEEVARESDTRLQVMRQNEADALKGDQQAMISLTANHIGMTLGMQKGARINQAVWEEAVKSRPLLAGIKAKFDKDGYLSGVTLTPDQIKQMVHLAELRRNDQWQQVQQAFELNGITNFKIPKMRSSTETDDSSGGNSGSAGNGKPKAGTVEGGYRFKGGDPSDQKNWEKVQ